MRKTILSAVMSVMLIPASLFGQSYASLWRQVKEAEKKDLPKTQMGLLGKIVEKAEADEDYGQLLKAGLKRVMVSAEVAPDSLRPAVERLAEKEKMSGDAVLKAVYGAVLYRYYTEHPSLADDSRKIADEYRARAMADPGLLASVKAEIFEPMVQEGYNAKIFGGDMLSVIGYEVGDYKTMHDYYSKADMPAAACVTALEMLRQNRTGRLECVNKSAYIISLDSLIQEYAALDVAGEVAIERYNYMASCRDVKVEDKISYIHYALDRWGGWQGAGQLRNAEKDLTAPKFGAEMESQVVIPDAGQTVRLRELRNIKSLTMRIYRAAVSGDTKLNPRTEDGYKSLKPLLTAMPELTQTRTYVGNPDYQLFDDSLTLPGLPAGVYMVEFQTAPATEVSRSLYYVTDVFLMTEALPRNTVRYAVVSASAGQPLPGATLRLTVAAPYSKTPKIVTLTCDSCGEARYKYTGRQPDRVFASTAADRYSPETGTYGNFSYYGNVRRTERTSVFTDRRIYRPGQTVRVAAVVYENTGKAESRALAGKTVTALLRDANHKIVAEKKIMTDSYGTCSADFVIPAGLLGGNFTVTVNNSSAGIRVEEYKRPTFQVEFPKINQKYQNGDTLLVKAKAVSYAGVPVQGASVRYRVVRRRAYWWINASRRASGSEVLASGETVTGADGTFTVEMPMVLPDDERGVRMFYNIVAEADVTDVGGESHSGELSVPLGNRATAFSCDIPEQVLADSLRTVTFSLRNYAGEEVSAGVRFYIDDASRWMTARTGVPAAVGGRLVSGRHRLFAVCENDTVEREFVVFGLDDSKPCVETSDWFYVSSEEFPADGRSVTVQAGASYSDAHIVYSIISGDEVIESGALDKDGELENRKFTYKEEYGDGLLLTYAWVKDGKCYSHSANIRRPVPDRRLRMKWKTFRDRLVPGQAEEWSVCISMPDGSPAGAQLMATLYDKSLDQLAEHSWVFSPGVSLSQPYTRWRYAYRSGIFAYGVQQWKPLAFRPLQVSRFDASLFQPVYRPVFNMATGGQMIMRKTRNASAMVMSADMAEAKTAFGEAALAEPELAAGDAESGMNISSGTGIQLRENLNETAFFYPALETSGDGSVTFRFTLPESLTTWRFMGMAHTADMYSGMIEGEAVARKDVMVQPNMPRFVRVGDKAGITAKVFNNGTEAVSGTARMELTDPETERIVYEESARFSVDAGQTAAVAFNYSPDGSCQLLVCRIVVAGKTFSDGEQHYLPVLPDRERVTVTVPFTQNGPGQKSIDLRNLFPAGADSRKLTVEYTGSPTWMMVQALPSLGYAANDNAVELCASLYANTLARALMKGSPRIKAVFDRWRMERQTGTSLESSLAKNGELKDIVLSETPWVADADREAEQKQRLADFFDGTAVDSRLAALTDKLSRLQNPDGSWSWWPGMGGNLYMTVEISQMLTRLNLMAGRQASTAKMLDAAFGYMGRQMVNKVDEMRKADAKGHKQVFPDKTALQYLYLCAVDGRKLEADTRSACDYLKGLLKKDISNQTIYEKALTAIVLEKSGDTARSREYVRSLKEFSVYDEKKGRYYDTPRAGYSWRDYRIPAEVAAMEAVAMITPDDRQTLEEMRLWLLQSKRTQAWDTPVNSADAVYAFLHGNMEVLSAREQASLAIDGKDIASSGGTAGIGYVKTSVDNPDGGVFTATKTSDGTSWGALYAQFMQNTKDVAVSESGISVRRDIVLPAGELKVGDRVKVRITLTASRDFDFVQVTDRRAACMEPVGQLSGYSAGAYCSPKDNATNYYFDRLSKGRHIIETEYYVDRAGIYETGTCTAGCAYAPEYRATAKSQTIKVNGK